MQREATKRKSSKPKSIHVLGEIRNQASNSLVFKFNRKNTSKNWNIYHSKYKFIETSTPNLSKGIISRKDKPAFIKNITVADTNHSYEFPSFGCLHKGRISDLISTGTQRSNC